MNTVVRVIITTILMMGIPLYTLYNIFKSWKVFIIAPLVIAIPFILIPLRKTYLAEFEIFLGHYLFYLAYIFFIVLGLFLLLIISKLFSLNIFDRLREGSKIVIPVLMVILGVLGVVGNRNFKRVKIREHNISLEKNSSKKSLKIGFISDIHLNSVFGTEKLDKILGVFKESGVELVLIGGDLLDNTHKTVKDNLGTVIDNHDFQHGIHMALGNHEYYGGIEENINFIKGSNINILRDEILNIGDIHIIARDDKHNKERAELSSLVEGIDKNLTKIVIDHNPISIPESMEVGADVHLSGHTHNGQMAPINLLVDFINENGYGYKKIQDTHTLVSSGLGTWMIPYRIGSTSEGLIINIETN